MVVFHILRNVFEGLSKAEQLDLSPTMSFFLGTKSPRKSAGISLLPEIAKIWNLDTLQVAKEISKSFNQLYQFSKGEHSIFEDIRFFSEHDSLEEIRLRFFQENPAICDGARGLITWYHEEGEKVLVFLDYLEKC